MDCISYFKIALALSNIIFFTSVLVVFREQFPVGIIIASLISLYIICGIVIFDNSSLLRDLKKQVDKFKSENDRLNKLNSTLNSNLDSMKEENEKYQLLNEQQAKTLTKFDGQLKENKTVIENGKKVVDDQRTNIVKQEEINKTQKVNLDKLTAQLDIITNNSISLAETNRQLNEQVKSFSMQLNIATSNNVELSNQLKKFELLNGNLKTIITTMAHSIDQSSGLEVELNRSINKVQEVSHDITQSAALMSRIVDGLSHLKFDQFDLNNDGEISRSEWQKAILVTDDEWWNITTKK